MVARSRGAITRNPVAIELYKRDDRWVPERGGFYVETLFGPIDAPVVVL